jgi:hypothetical protein
MSVEYKSTGVLLDELFTADLKLEHWPDDESVIQRRHALGNAIQARLLKHSQMNSWNNLSEVWSVARELKDVLRECWNAQEVVMRYNKFSLRDLETGLDHETLISIAEAAIEAQTTNSERNRLIRKIDTLLQDGENAPLRKTYS